MAKEIKALIEELESALDKIKEKDPSTLSIDNDPLLVEARTALHDLRVDGVNKVSLLSEKIAATKKNKMLENAERDKIIGDCRKGIAAALKVSATNNSSDKDLTSAAVKYASALSQAIIAHTNAQENEKIAKLKKDYLIQVEGLKADAQNKITAATSPNQREQLKYELKSTLFDAKSKHTSKVDACKMAKLDSLTAKIQENRSLRNGKSSLQEDLQLSLKNYLYNWTFSRFMLNNGLYLAIIVFFIICMIIAPLSGAGNLLSLPNIFTILEQSSTRMFYALGVAGLILIAGTDLSVGRMVAMGAVVTGLILHPGTNIVKFFNMGPWDFTTLPMAGRLGMALSISIIACVAFSMFAGFFSAKLKIHPFISTLATQLIIYGLLFFGTTGTPVGSIDSEMKNLLGGRWVLGYIGPNLITFPKLIIPAIVAIIVAWFIWNKTTFGKNMYAVGGNAEAATVSGISVFWVTMGIFIMAGVFYGCGAFLEAFRANASAGTGQGYELDAIAACVVGGISFNGGIGKVSGAVIGVIIFTGLTYCLTFLGIDTNLQFVFKGFIIIAAVALDSIKYLKRK